MDFPRIMAQPRHGAEPLHADGHPLSHTILDFWRWSLSDLLSNATRGILAEFIVATALAIPLTQARDEWAPFDLVTPEGIKVEVKSAAYIQSWHQQKPSVIQFGVSRKRGWDAALNVQEGEARRHADVYVFALLAHLEQATIDPPNVSQWQFFVLPTSVLDTRTRSQHSITLRSLETLSSGAVSYHAVAEVVRAAAIVNAGGRDRSS